MFLQYYEVLMKGGPPAGRQMWFQEQVTPPADGPCHQTGGIAAQVWSPSFSQPRILIGGIQQAPW